MHFHRRPAIGDGGAGHFRSAGGNVIGLGGHGLQMIDHIADGLRLLIHRVADFQSDGIHLADGDADGGDGLDGLAGGLLDGLDLLGDLAGGAGRLVGEIFHFSCHHGKPLTGIPRPRRLDGGVQSQQIGLRSDVVDQADDLADMLGGLRQATDHGVGLASLIDGPQHHRTGTLYLTGNGRDRVRQNLGQPHYVPQLLCAGQGLIGGLLGLVAGGIGGIAQMAGQPPHAFHARGHAAEYLREVAVEIIHQRQHGGTALGDRAGHHLIMLGLHFLQATGVVTKDRDGLGHLPHLVVTVEGGDRHGEIIVGKGIHGQGHGLHRLRDATGQKQSQSRGQHQRHQRQA